MADRADSSTERVVHPAPGAAGVGEPYHRGVAKVGRPVQPGYGPDTLVEAFGPVQRPAPRPPLRYRVRQLRRGGELTAIGGLLAFVSWGIWVISLRGGDLTIPVLGLVLVLLVGAGIFALCRLLGRMVLERSLGRGRRSAWPSHLATGAFLAAAGITYLGQTAWVIDVWIWLKALR